MVRYTIPYGIPYGTACTVLYCIVLYCIVLCCTLLCHAVLTRSKATVVDCPGLDSGFSCVGSTLHIPAGQQFLLPKSHKLQN